MESRPKGGRRVWASGRGADIEAGPWLGDTPGFNNRFIPCTRASGRDWELGWGGEGTILHTG